MAILELSDGLEVIWTGINCRNGVITGDEALLSHLVNSSIFNTNLYIDRGVHISPIDAKWSSVLGVLYRIRVATVLIDTRWPQEYNFTTAIICIVFTSRAAVEGEFNDFNIHKQVSFIGTMTLFGNICH